MAPTKNCTPLASLYAPLEVGSTLDSAWRWGMGDDRVQPVATRRAAFCVRCRADMCDGARSGHHAGLAYSRIGLINCL